MRTAVTGPTETAFENIDRHADELQKKADRLQAIVDEHRRFRKWYEDMAGDASRWEVKKIDPVYFLPHRSFWMTSGFMRSSPRGATRCRS